MPPKRAPKRQLSKNTPARRKRGSTGLSKDDRVKKQDALTDFFAAKKHLRDLKEISDSSSSDLSEGDDSYHSTESEKEQEKDHLTKLRSLLGVKVNEDAAAPFANNSSSSTSSKLKQKKINQSSTGEATLEDFLEIAAASKKKTTNNNNNNKNRKQQQNEDEDDDSDDFDEADEGYFGDMDEFIGYGGDEAGGDFDEFVDEDEEDELAPFEEGSDGGMHDENDAFIDEEGEWEIAEDQENVVGTDDDEDEDEEDKKNVATANVNQIKSSSSRLMQEAEKEVRFAANETNKDDFFWLKFIDNVCGKPDETQPQVNDVFVFSDNKQSEARNVSVAFSEKALENVRKIRLMEENDGPSENNKSKNKKQQEGLNKIGYIQEKDLRDNILLFETKKEQQQKQVASSSASSQTTSNSTNSIFRTCLRLFSSYADVSLAVRSWDNANDICKAYAAHCINHLQKAYAVTKANDNLLRAFENEQQEQENEEEEKKTIKKKNNNKSSLVEDASQLQVRDRGFTRPRILVLFPMRNSAYRFMKDFAELLGIDWDVEFAPNTTFESDFTEMEEVKDPTFKRRPIDFQKQFNGNINDTFCFGVSFFADKNKNATSKNNTRHFAVYVPFLDCDMIVASPLGLRKRLLKDGNLGAALSSIEVTIVDEAQVILMQSWAHLDAVFSLLNKRPTDTTEGLCDVSRIYDWALNGQSRRHRQTIMISAFTNAAVTRTFRESCCNNSGKIIVVKTFGKKSTDGSAEGVIAQTPQNIRQHFVRLRTESIGEVDDARFNYFTKTWFPTKIQPLVSQNVRTILFVPSYFDFARLRTWLNEQHRFDFAVICEHSTQKEQRQALGQFTDQERCLLVMTERFYFFRRYFVREAEVVFFYSPPLNNFFYSDVVSKLNTGSPHCQSQTLFCRYDVHELTRVIGSERTKQMLTRQADAYMLVNSSSTK